MIKVLDASIGVKWFIEEQGSAQALELFEQIFLHPKEYVVPELFFYEIYAVCMRRYPEPEMFAKKGVSLLERVPFLRIPLTEAIAQEGTQWIKKGLTGYDAIYAALAKSLRGCWITFDKEAAKKLRFPEWIRVLE